ncbi:MAG TPA: DUF167 domain-containing protein [Alphaproteobacteria bacterium]|nr:DUF167 domain-containing protein [Alphaproteobacteria bacterium]
MPFQLHSKGVTVRIRLTPGARQTAVQGFADEAGGADAGRFLKISVNAVPEDGKANRALVDFLAQEWGLPKSAFSLISGDTSRQKTLLIEASEPAILYARLAALYSK